MRVWLIHMNGRIGEGRPGRDSKQPHIATDVQYGTRLLQDVFATITIVQEQVYERHFYAILFWQREMMTAAIDDDIVWQTKGRASFKSNPKLGSDLPSLIQLQ